jgi:biopolymer transport protein ExbD
MASTSEKDGLITEINVTPLVDVVLVLLIIFMATAPLLNRRSLSVNVPRAAHTETKATKTLQIQFTADRKIMVETAEMTVPDLDRQLRERQAADPTLHVSVSADQSVPYGEVVGLLDVIRGAGVKKLALEVKPKASREK